MKWDELENHLQGRACPEGFKWARIQASPKDAYENCERSDWLIWVLYSIGCKHEEVRLVICDIAETALPYVIPGDDRPKLAIKAAREYANSPWKISEDAMKYAARQAFRASMEAKIKLKKKNANTISAAEKAAEAACNVVIWPSGSTQDAALAIAYGKCGEQFPMNAEGWLVVDDVAWKKAYQATYKETMKLHCEIIRKRFPWSKIESLVLDQISMYMIK